MTTLTESRSSNNCKELNEYLKIYAVKVILDIIKLVQGRSVHPCNNQASSITTLSLPRGSLVD